jgi:hypothetical protein
MAAETDHENAPGGEVASVRLCPNCGRDRPESFCPACGQSDRDYARSFRPVLGDFLRETFEMDSRLFRTLKLLLFRPGGLTQEFSRNRRASYMSPVRLYIFASLVFFLLLSITGRTDTSDTTIDVRLPSSQQAVENDRVAAERLEAFTAALPPEYRTKVEGILDRPEGDVRRESLLRLAAEDPGELGGIDSFFLLAAIDLLHDPSVVGERLIGNLPIAMFFLLPVYALVLAGFHFRKKRFFVEHLVFAVHVQTFIFVAYTLSMLFVRAGPLGWVGNILLLIPYPYFLIALRRYYGDGWMLAAAKSIGVLILYSFAFIPAFLVSVFVTT